MNYIIGIAVVFGIILFGIAYTEDFIKFIHDMKKYINDEVSKEGK